MKLHWRQAVAVVVLFFAWKGAALDLEWPLRAKHEIVQPPKELLDWGRPVAPVVAKMTPKDRLFMSSLYDAMAFVIVNDGQRPDPIITDTESFAAFHAGTLKLAVNRGDVGKYDGLAEAIDQVFVAACGADVAALTPDARARLVSACGVLSWVSNIGRNE